MSLGPPACLQDAQRAPGLRRPLVPRQERQQQELPGTRQQQPSPPTADLAAAPPAEVQPSASASASRPQPPAGSAQPTGGQDHGSHGAQLKQEVTAATSLADLQALLPQLTSADTPPHVLVAAAVKLARMQAAGSSAGSRAAAQQLMSALSAAAGACMHRFTFPNLSGLLWSWSNLGAPVDRQLLQLAEERLLRCKVDRERAGRGRWMRSHAMP
jgi:hypothetical protein